MTRLVAGGLILLVLAGTAFAETEHLIDRRFGRKNVQRVRAYTRPTVPPAGGLGGCGWVTVRIENPDEKPHDVEISLTEELGSRPTSIRRTVEVAAGRASTVHLPVPCCGLHTRYRLGFRLDGVEAPGRAEYIEGFGDPGNSVLSLLRGNNELHRRWEPALTRDLASGRTVWRTPEHLPDGVEHLSGFAAILVDASDPRLTADRQSLLLRYVACGGGLVVLNASAGSGGLEGALRARSRREPSPTGKGARLGRAGFGQWVTIPGRYPEGVRLGSLFRDGHRNFGTGIPAALTLPVEIPGLGEVPVRAFFLLILVFVVLVGPVSYVWLRRRGRRALLLVTVPASGMICTLAILLYGFFSEGFGIKGEIRSVTILDQRNHEAVTVAGRTLYAGLSPSTIVPDPSTQFFSLHNTDTERAFERTPLRRDVTPGGVIDGSALPSRTPIAFFTRTAGRSRERLRFRRLETGGFEVLAAPGLAPVEQSHALVLRTPDGRYFVSDRTGQLLSTDERKAERHVGTLIHEVSGVDFVPPDDTRNSYSYFSNMDDAWSWPGKAADGGPLSVGFWFKLRGEQSLPPGCFLARVERIAAVDDLDLDVEYRVSRHLVLGILGEEDILE